MFTQSLIPAHVFPLFFFLFLFLSNFLSTGVWRDRMWPDGWTAVTADGKRSAQFEHTLLVTMKIPCTILIPIFQYYYLEFIGLAKTKQWISHLLDNLCLIGRRFCNLL